MHANTHTYSEVVTARAARVPNSKCGVRLRTACLLGNIFIIFLNVCIYVIIGVTPYFSCICRCNKRHAYVGDVEF